MRCVSILGTVVLAVTVVCARPALGGSLQKQRVSAGAAWLVHIDVESLKGSEIVQFLQKEGHTIDADLDVQEVQQHLGIDPLTDVLDLTIYGDGDPESDPDTIIVATATAAIDALIDKVRAEAPGYKQFDVAGYSVHSFDADGKDLLFHVRTGPTSELRTIVIAKTPEQIARAAALVEGKGVNLARADGEALKAEPQAGSFLFVAADGLAWIKVEPNDAGAAMLQNAKKVLVDIGEHQGELFATGNLTAANTEDATNIADLLRGALALGKMAAGHEPALAPLANTINTIKITVAESSLTVNLRQKSQTLIDTLKAIHQAERAKHKHDGDHHDHDHDHGHDAGDH